MSVIVSTRINGDGEAFRKFTETRNQELVALMDDAKAKGCLGHRHAIGDGFVLVVDEWESAEAFNDFFEGNEAIASIMSGYDAKGEPEILIGEKLDSPDTF
jgi:heme-degrading monooxygenase HmoA